MNAPTFSTRCRLSRRTLLRGAGVALALPWLEAMQPAFARSRETEGPRRFVSVSHGLGFIAENFFPEEAGEGYAPSPYLATIPDVLGDLTVFSGVSLKDVKAGHQAEACILTGAPIARGGTGGFRNTISLDQLMAKHLGGETRYPSLVMNPMDASSPSYTESGAMIPAEQSATELFAKLFIDETPEQRERNAARLREGRSIMDIVGADAQSLERELGPGDRRKLDAYFTSVRDLEKRLAANEGWALRPKPKVDSEGPQEPTDRNDLTGHQRAMFDVIKLALETDSTRFLTLHLGSGNPKPPLEGVSQGHHTLSHHGKDPEKLDELAIIEREILEAWADLVRGLKADQEGEGTLLDRTMVLLTSNLGNASAHTTENMPALLAGGGFRHGRHLAFDREDNYNLANVYLQMGRRAGLELEAFATSSDDSVAGLESR